MITSIFQSELWLNLVAPGKWRFLEVKEGERVLGRWPVVEEFSRLGMKTSTLPPLTLHLGPSFFIDPSKKGSSVLTFKKKVTQQLLESLPDYDYFCQTLTDQEQVLPFHWGGFKLGIDITYRIEDCTKPEVLLAGFDQNIRQKIRKSSSTLSIARERDPSQLWNLLAHTFNRKNEKNVYSRELIDRMIPKMIESGHGGLWVSRDEKGVPHAAVFAVWDQTRMYYLLSGADPSKRDSGAVAGIIWHLLNECGRMRIQFDFEGSSLPGVEQFITGFSPKQHQLIRISKKSMKKKIRDLF